MLYIDATRKLNGSKLFIVLLLYLFFLVKEFFTQTNYEYADLHAWTKLLPKFLLIFMQTKKKGLEDKVPNSSLPSIMEREFLTHSKEGDTRSK
jgi:hypothetical protein